MSSVNQIRKTFLNYFEKNGHKIVPASSLVPDNDPTLMFTNSGMVQFKNILAGNETRDYTRAATSQKALELAVSIMTWIALVMTFATIHSLKC